MSPRKEAPSARVVLAVRTHQVENLKRRIDEMKLSPVREDYDEACLLETLVEHWERTRRELTSSELEELRALRVEVRSYRKRLTD